MSQKFRLVIIESPFAPTTPLPKIDCYFDDKPACPFGVYSSYCTSCEIYRQAVMIRQKELDTNIRYVRKAMKDCLHRGEAPYASHALYTQFGVLDDTIPEERKLGMEAGFAWRDVAEASIVYTDLGTSKGMQAGIEDAVAKGRLVDYRSLGPDWDR